MRNTMIKAVVIVAVLAATSLIPVVPVEKTEVSIFETFKFEFVSTKELLVSHASSEVGTLDQIHLLSAAVMVLLGTGGVGVGSFVSIKIIAALDDTSKQAPRRPL